MFPQLAELKWEFDWAGWPAITKNHTPHLFELDRGVYAGLGYNGRGVASATLMGEQLANVILGKAEPLLQVKPLEGFTFTPFDKLGSAFTSYRVRQSTRSTDLSDERTHPQRHSRC